MKVVLAHLIKVNSVIMCNLPNDWDIDIWTVKSLLYPKCKFCFGKKHVNIFSWCPSWVVSWPIGHSVTGRFKVLSPGEWDHKLYKWLLYHLYQMVPLALCFKFRIGGGDFDHPMTQCITAAAIPKGMIGWRWRTNFVSFRIWQSLGPNFESVAPIHQHLVTEYSSISKDLHL